MKKLISSVALLFLMGGEVSAASIKNTVYAGLGAGIQRFTSRGVVAPSNVDNLTYFTTHFGRDVFGATGFVGYRAMYNNFIMGVEVDTFTPATYKKSPPTPSQYTANYPIITMGWSAGGSILLGYQLESKGTNVAVRLGADYRTFIYSPRIPAIYQPGPTATNKMTFASIAPVIGFVMALPVGKSVEVSADYRIRLGPNQTRGVKSATTLQVKEKITMQIFMLRLAYKFIG